jgi:hypothetical protein
MDNASNSIDPAQVDYDEALARVFAKVDRASKDAKNPHLNSKYATLAAVDAACREALIAEHFAWPQVVTTRRTEHGLEVVVSTTLRRKGLGLLSGELPMPMGGKASAQEIGSAITYGRRYALSALLGVCTEDDDGHAASQPKDRKGAKGKPTDATEPEPDRLWMAYEQARAKAARHLRVTEPQAHQRILALAEVTHGGDPSDPEVKRMIAVAEAMLVTDREPLTPGSDREHAAAKGEQTVPAEPKAKPRGKGSPAESPAVQAARKAADSARAAYQDTCKEEGVPETPWLDIAYKALGKPWDIAKGTHGVEDYEKLAAAYEAEIDRVRAGEGA